MPIVANSNLPTFADLRRRGEQILDLDEALDQDIRELHIGLLNMMPDAALQVTERQYLRLLGSANQIVQIYVHPFTVAGLTRSATTQAYLDAHYRPFDALKEEGLDALIVSGANVTSPRLEDEEFWTPLGEVMAWAREHVTSVLCSCLATHALLQQFHDVRRRPLLSKRWGVFEHRVVRPEHPLMHGTNTRFDVPHSRWNEITTEQVREVGIDVLVESVEGDFHLGTSPDGIRLVYLQGHPEYEAASLLKEYKRELARFLDGELAGIPPLPERYLVPEAARLLHAHVAAAVRARDAGRPLPPFPEGQVVPLLDNTWTDTGAAVFNNWMGLIYRLTDIERGVPFMPDVDPDDPLGLVAARRASAPASGVQPAGPT